MAVFMSSDTGISNTFLAMKSSAYLRPFLSAGWVAQGVFGPRQVEIPHQGPLSYKALSKFSGFSWLQQRPLTQKKFPSELVCAVKQTVKTTFLVRRSFAGPSNISNRARALQPRATSLATSP